MKYEGNNVYSSGEIADLLGFDDYHRVSNYLKKIGANNVTKKGNTRYYSEKTKETVITYFKALERKGSGESKKDQLIEELRTQLRTAQKESVDKLAEQKKEYDSRLADQKNSYERIISAKDDDISNLKDTVTNLRKQQDVTNEQIKQLATVTRQAQSLNLVDKSPEQLKLLKGDAETSNEWSDSEKETDNQQTSEPEKPHQNWWQRHFSRKN
jgi:arginine utilization protein RocB